MQRSRFLINFDLNTHIFYILDVLYIVCFSGIISCYSQNTLNIPIVRARRLIRHPCDELGRRSTWVALDRERGPVSLTFSVRLGGLPEPSAVAERLPKVLIHRNVPGEGVHDLLRAADAAWARAAPAGASTGSRCCVSS